MNRDSELPDIPRNKTVEIKRFKPLTVEFEDGIKFVEGQIFIILPPTNEKLSGVLSKRKKLQAVAIEIVVEKRMSLEDFLEYLANMSNELEEIWKKRRGEYISKMYSN